MEQLGLRHVYPRDVGLQMLDLIMQGVAVHHRFKKGAIIV